MTGSVRRFVPLAQKVPAEATVPPRQDARDATRPGTNCAARDQWRSAGVSENGISVGRQVPALRTRCQARMSEATRPLSWSSDSADRQGYRARHPGIVAAAARRRGDRI